MDCTDGASESITLPQNKPQEEVAKNSPTQDEPQTNGITETVVKTEQDPQPSEQATQSNANAVSPSPSTKQYKQYRFLRKHEYEANELINLAHFWKRESDESEMLSEKMGVMVTQLTHLLAAAGVVSRLHTAVSK